MALLETLVLKVGSSIAKSVLKRLLNNSEIMPDASSSIVDIVQSHISDTLTQRRAKRQFEIIGEKVGESLLPIFEVEGIGLDENQRIAIAEGVADTLDLITGIMLVQKDLDPASLAKHLLQIRSSEKLHFAEVEATLYRRVISLSCEYIIDIASTLPGFTERAFSELLQRETKIMEKVELILQAIQHSHEQMNPGEKATYFESQYRRAVQRRLDELQLFGVDVTSARRQHSLSVAYVRLSVEQKFFEPAKDVISNVLTNSASVLDASSEINSRETKRVVVIDEALASSRCLLLRGPAGSGKTSLLQWIAVSAAMQSFQGVLASWNGTIPFYIRLRSCISIEQFGPLGHLHLPRPEDFPGLITTAIADTMPKGWVHEQLELGRAIVLVDGVDEVSEMQRKEVREWLKELIVAYNKARFIVTSRLYAVEERWMNTEDFHEAILQPMNLSDMFSFIEHWHKAVALELHNEQERATLPSLAKSLKSELEHNRAQRDLATSPLLCAMLCALNRDRHEQLPTDRINLYKACCELLIERRDRERRVPLTDYPAAILGYSQKLKLLEDLAYWMLRNGWTEVQAQQVDTHFQQKLNMMRNVPQNLLEVSGLKHVRRLFVDRSGMLREPVEARIDFSHRTFQEFLAAQAALDEGDLGVLVQNAHKDQWREFILLASGLASRKVREELIHMLIARGNIDQLYRPQLYLLVVSCLDTSIEEPGIAVKSAVQKCLLALVQPQDDDEARSWASAGELAIQYLNKEEHASPETKASCIHALALIGGQRVLSTLSGYLLDTEQDVIDALWENWIHFQDDEKTSYAKRILSKMNRSPSFSLSIASFTSLDDFQYFRKITSLSLQDCQQIRTIGPLTLLNQLIRLSLQDCLQIRNLVSLSSLTQLSEFRLRGCSQLSDFSSLSSLTHLTLLDLSNCQQLSDLTPLASLTQLSTLNLSGCQQLSDLTPLASLTQLSTLNLSGCQQLSDLTPLTSLTQLSTLDLSGCQRLSDLTPLASLTQLKRLDIWGCSQITILAPLSSLAQLKQLYLSDYKQLTDITFLESLTQLNILDLHGCSQITDISPLASLTQMTSLDLRKCTRISSLSPLSKLSNLYITISPEYSRDILIPDIMKKNIRIIG